MPLIKSRMEKNCGIFKYLNNTQQWGCTTYNLTQHPGWISQTKVEQKKLNTKAHTLYDSIKVQNQTEPIFGGKSKRIAGRVVPG